MPVGLAKTVIPTPRLRNGESGEFIGPNCALCHEGQLNYKGRRVRINGGVGNMLDFSAYITALDDAIQATVVRARQVRSTGGATESERVRKPRAALRKRFEGEAAKVHEYRTRVMVTPTTWGPSRMDAIAMIVNRLMAVLPGIPENWSTGTAPTKPPFLWNSGQGSWTQWRGVQQDPIFRNLTETMGVFMSIDLRSKTPAEGLFRSHAAIRELQRVENQLVRLAPPSWPEDVFGKIDREKAKAGKALFMTHCSGCHNAWPVHVDRAEQIRQALCAGGLGAA